MERSIKISVVIPVYNAAVFLSKCLKSLHDQEYKDIEYILVDDGSKDNSLQMCRDYASIDDRFVVLSKENGGPSSARNLAIANAKGEYLTFVDSDDYVAENAYSRIAALLESNGNPDCLIFGANLLPEDAPDYMKHLVSPRDVVYNAFEPKVLFDEVGARPFLWLQVVKRSIITDNSIVMDESIRLGEDQLFQMEFLPYANKIVFVSEKLYFYRWRRAGSIMYETSAKFLQKLLLHVNLVDKAFALVEEKNRGEQMKNKTFVWSIFFLFHDVNGLLEEEQNAVAKALVDVWQKHNCNELVDNLDAWGKARYDQILLMAEENRDARIEKYIEANAALEAEIEELKKLPEYQEYIKEFKQKKNLFKGFFVCLKENGLRYTVKRVFAKLSGK